MNLHSFACIICWLCAAAGFAIHSPNLSTLLIVAVAQSINCWAYYRRHRRRF